MTTRKLYREMPRDKVWTFKSKSSPGKFYEVVLWGDGRLSCNCPGWTRRVERVNGQTVRTCRHITEVTGILLNQKQERSLAEERKERQAKYVATFVQTTTPYKSNAPTHELVLTRTFNFDEE